VDDGADEVLAAGLTQPSLGTTTDTSGRPAPDPRPARRWRHRNKTATPKKSKRPCRKPRSL